MSQVRLKPGVKRLFIVLAILAAFVWGVPRYAAHRGWRPTMLKTLIPQKVDTVDATAINSSGKVAPMPLPTKEAAQLRTLPINYEIWAWNAQFGLIYANGGPATTRGSFMEKNGVNLHLKRQDDTSQMQNDLLTFATALKSGTAEPQTGTHFVNIMGDGAAQFFAALNPRLEKLGP
jgi:OOP family OmpA-OmpF porin